LDRLELAERDRPLRFFFERRSLSESERSRDRLRLLARVTVINFLLT
jgi:hypothetical protein